MKIFNKFIKGIVCTFFILTSSTVLAEKWDNITHKVTVTKYQSVFNRFFRTYITNIDLENATNSPIFGDLRLTIVNPNLSPKEPDGFDDAGNAYYIINSDRLGSRKASLQVNFIPSGRTRPSFSTKVELLDRSPNCSATYCFNDAVFFTTADETVNLSVNYDNSQKVWSVGDENTNYDPDVNYYLSRKDSVWLTHLLYPASQYAAQTNSIWTDTEVNYPNKVSSELTELGSRTPLILIHGWQGGSLFKNHANYIGSLQHDTVPEQYFQEFLAFYNSESSVAKQLQEKYKLFLYKYPSFEHITYNGRILGEAIYNIPELKSYVDSGKKMKIVAHSMGGLVARSFVEEHGVGYAETISANDLDLDEKGNFSQVIDGKNIVDTLITLATPHHGSPGAGKKWADIGDIIKERTTPGALDLMWDDFDGGMSNNLFDAASNPNVYTCGSPSEDCLFDFTERNGLENFDLYYGGWNYEPSKVDGRQFRHSNPWLRTLNDSYFRTSTAVKYKLYSGSVTSEIGSFEWLFDDSILIDTLKNGFFSVSWQSVVHNAKYVLNDAVVPTRSALLDYYGEWNDESGNISSIFNGFADYENLTYKSGTTPYGNAYRFFHDYDHDKMRGGAGKTSAEDWLDESDYDYDENWNDASIYQNSATYGYSYKFVEEYLTKLGTTFSGDKFSNTERLTNEPLFLAISEDLGIDLPRASTTDFFDAFTDKNYTENLAWTAQNNDDRPGSVDMSNDYPRFLRGGVGGNGGSVGIDMNVDIPVTLDTSVQFDVLANSRSVGAGCGWTCGEYPANVRIYVEDAAGNEHIVQYSYNYGSAIQDRNDSVMTRFSYSIPQGTWSRNLKYNIKEAWPQAAKITRVYLFASGWDFDGAVDNIKIYEDGNPVVKSFEDFSLMEVSVDNLDYDMVGTISPGIPNGYRLADWNDLIIYSNSGGNLETLWSNIGQVNLMMTRNGDPTAADNIYYNGIRFHRFYFATWSYRLGQTPHNGYLSHAHIGQMHLGSWTPRGHVLLIKN